MKDCPTCQTPKPLAEFHRNASRPDGYHGECKQCVRQRREQRPPPPPRLPRPR